mgnify:FL=1
MLGTFLLVVAAACVTSTPFVGPNVLQASHQLFLGGASPPPHSLCMNTGVDNYCDSPGSELPMCAYGADCVDCAPRMPRSPPQPPVSSPPRPITSTPATAAPPALCINICLETCSYADCDNGGPSSEFPVCAYGTNCGGCGSCQQLPPSPPRESPGPPSPPRAPPGPPLPPRAPPATPSPPSLCSAACIGMHAYGSNCDDGGPCNDGGAGTEFSVCQYGADCADCRPRATAAPAAAARYFELRSGSTGKLVRYIGKRVRPTVEETAHVFGDGSGVPWGAVEWLNFGNVLLRLGSLVFAVCWRQKGSDRNRCLGLAFLMLCIPRVSAMDSTRPDGDGAETASAAPPPPPSPPQSPPPTRPPPPPPQPPPPPPSPQVIKPCTDELSSGAYLSGESMPCSFFSAQPSACASYSIARTTCPVACGTCSPPPPGPSGLTSGLMVLEGAIMSHHRAGVHAVQPYPPTPIALPSPPPRPPSTKLGRALPSSQHDGRQLAHSTTIVGSGSIVGRVASASLLDYAISVAVSGSYAYVAAHHSDSLVVVDVSNPASPVIWGSVVSSSLLDGPANVAVSGVYAYVAASESDALVVVDVSNPASPVIRGSVVSSSLLDGPANVAVSGVYAYVAASESDALVVVDVSNPASPVIRGSVVSSSVLDGAISVALSGVYAYVAAHFSDALVVVDVSNPASPVIRGSVVSSSLLDGARDVAVSGSFAYVAAQYSNSLVVIDVSNPTSPVIRGSVVSSSLLNDAVGVALSGVYACVAAADSNSLVVVDVSNPASPVIRGSVVSSSLLGGVRVTQSRGTRLALGAMIASFMLAPAAPPPAEARSRSRVVLTGTFCRH